MTEPEHTDKAEKRGRPWRPLQIILTTIAVCIVIFIFWLLTITGGTPNVTFNYTERYNELFRPTDFDEADNAADLYNLAFVSFRKMPWQLDYAYWQNKWPGELDEETRSAIADWLNSNATAFEYARLAARKRFYWNVPPAASPSPFDWDCDAMRNLAKAVILQALFDAYNDRHAEVFAELETAFFMANHYAGQRAIMEQLAAAKCHSDACAAMLCILANSQPNAQLLAQFRTFLEQRNPLPPFSFSSEQLATEWHIEKCFTDDGRGNGRIIVNEISRIMLDYYDHSTRPDWQERFNYLAERAALIFKATSHDDRRTTAEKTQRLYAILEEIADKTPFELKSRSPALDREVDTMIGKGQGLFLQHFAPPGISFYAQRYSALRALVSVIALMRYRTDTGEYPETLHELQSAGYLSALPADPYSEKPLVYRKTDDGFTLYSVGRDFTDNGGLKHEWYSATPGDDYIYWPVPVREMPDPAEWGEPLDPNDIWGMDF